MKKLIIIILLLSLQYSNIAKASSSSIDAYFPPETVSCWWPWDGDFNTGTYKYWVTQPSSTSYFSPQIEVYHEMCFAYCCATQRAVLNYYGQCADFWMTLGDRVCARIAAPAPSPSACCEANNNCESCETCATSCDQVCIAQTTSSGQITGYSCNETTYSNSDYTKSKICAYEDPMFPADLNDGESGSMPWQSLTPVDMATVPNALWVDPTAAITLELTDVMLSFIPGASFVNYVVAGYSGCVDIPLAPNPPPYCPSVPLTPPDPTITNLCASIFNTSNVVSSTTTSTVNAVCEYGLNYYNRFENPGARIGFDNELVQCTSSATNSSGTPTCVNFNAISQGNIATQSLNELPLCSATSDTNCFFTDATPSTILIPTTPLRTLYSIASSPTVSGYSSWFLPGTGQTISLAGAQYSNFNDINVTFPKGAMNATPSSINIIDEIGGSRNFYAQSQDSSSPDVLCVYEMLTGGPAPWGAQNYDSSSSSAPYDPYGPYGDSTRPNPISCFTRPAMILPQVAACDNDNCSSTVASQAMSFSLGSGSYLQTSSLTYKPVAGGTQEVTYLHGYPFFISLSDNYYSSQDSCGSQIGNYNYSSDGTGTQVVASPYQNVALYNSILTQLKTMYNNNTFTTLVDLSTPAKTIYYQGGIEFYQGLYIRGATQICLQGYNGTNQVLAKSVSTTNYSSSNSSVLCNTNTSGLTANTTGSSSCSINNAISSTTACSTGTNTTISASNDARDRIIPVYNSSYTTSVNPSDSFYSASSQTCSSTQSSTCTQISTTETSCTSDSSGTCTSFEGSIINYSGMPPYYPSTSAYQSCTSSAPTYPTTTSICNDNTACCTTGSRTIADPYLPGESIRNETPLELGLCVAAALPTCDAITETSDSSGYATWPGGLAGYQYTGTCPTINGVSSDSSSSLPTRYCQYSNTSLTEGSWGPITNPCQATCPAMTPSVTYASTTGVVWTQSGGQSITLAASLSGADPVTAGTCDTSNGYFGSCTGYNGYNLLYPGGPSYTCPEYQLCTTCSDGSNGYTSSGDSNITIIGQCAADGSDSCELGSSAYTSNGNCSGVTGTNDVTFTCGTDGNWVMNNNCGNKSCSVSNTNLVNAYGTDNNACSAKNSNGGKITGWIQNDNYKTSDIVNCNQGSNCKTYPSNTLWTPVSKSGLTSVPSGAQPYYIKCSDNCSGDKHNFYSGPVMFCQNGTWSSVKICDWAHVNCAKYSDCSNNPTFGCWYGDNDCGSPNACSENQP